MAIACSTSAFKSDLDDALSRVAALGFHDVALIAIGGWDHVSLPALVDDYDDEMSRTKDLLEKYNLNPIAVAAAFDPPLFERADSAGNRERLRQVRTLARFMNDLGIDSAGYYPGFRQESADPEEIYRNTRETIREIQAIADEAGVVMGPELHIRSNLETLPECERILADLPDLTIEYDPSHFITQGIAIGNTAPLIDRAHHIGIRGASAGRLQAAGPENRWFVPWIMEHLGQIGYEGHIAVEYLSGRDFDVEEEIADCRAQIEEHLP